MKGAAPYALKDPEKHKALEIPGRAAHKRAKGEEGDGKDEIALSSKELAQPSGHGDDDSIGCKIGGNGPGGFIDACGEAPANMIERDIDDRCVDDYDKRRQHDCDDNNPSIHTNMRSFGIDQDRGNNRHPDP